MHLTAESRLSSCNSCQSSSVIYKKFLEGEAPTLLTKISTGPSSCTDPIKESVDSLLPISATKPLIKPLADSNEDNVSTASGFLAQKLTSAPYSANILTTASPMPKLAPVTTALLPFKSKSIIGFPLYPNPTPS